MSDITPRSSRLVIADDFGMSPAVNAGIAEAFARGWLTGTSLMANMPAFEEAVALLTEHRWPGQFGVHLNLSEGQALTPALHNCPRFADSAGQLHWKHRMIWTLSPAETTAIRDEWRAQIQRVIAAGITPSHLDSHHHTHTALPLNTLALELAREFDIPRVRLSRNCRPARNPAVNVYKRWLNQRIATAGRAQVRYFGTATESAALLARGETALEVMTHPSQEPSGRLIDHTNGRSLEETLAPVLTR